MQHVMQVIVGMDVDRRFYLWEPTADNYRKMHDALRECDILVANDADVDRHPRLDFNKILFTSADVTNVVAWWAARTKSKIPMSDDGVKKIWRHFIKFLHDWGFVAMKSADLRAEGRFCRGFIFLDEAWNTFGYRITRGGRVATVPRNLKDRYDEITAARLEVD